MHPDEIQQKKNIIFEEQKEILQKAMKGGFEKYADSLKNIDDFFILKDHAIRCIDEGTPEGLHSAGSGILRHMPEVLDSFRRVGITEVTSHDGCGAAKLYARQNNLLEEKSDEYGKKWSADVAKFLGVPYRHIAFIDMKRPKEFHIARVAYYDGTGKFNYNDGGIFPPGFIISRKIQSEQDSLSEAGVSLDIAFGNHGFGPLITEDDPFIFIAIGEDEEDAERLQEELKKLEHSYGKKVIIDGFIAPKIEEK